MNRDNDLLRQFADHGDERAFGEFVGAKINLVYSAALRQVGDAHLANDVVQGVFLAAAANASTLKRHPVITGWLYTTTRHVATKAVRSETRWRRRENEANAMHAMHDDTTNLGDIRPVIDEAMNELGADDRAALLLRFFECRSQAEVGQALGLGENAARMRINRALERLRERLAHRGITSTAAIVGGALASQASIAAPTGLAASVTTAALTGAAALAPSAATTSGLLALMTTTKAIAAGAVALGLFAAGSYVGIRYVQQNSARDAAGATATDTSELLDLKRQNARLSADLAELERLQTLAANHRGNAAVDAAKSESATDRAALTAADAQERSAAINRLKGKWAILAELQNTKAAQTQLALVDRMGKLNEAALKIFDVTPAEHDALERAVDSATQRMTALEQQNATMTPDGADKLTIRVQSFPEAGGKVYDALMKSFADTLGPDRNAAFLQLAATQVDQAFSRFGAVERTVSVTLQPGSKTGRYLVTDYEVSAGSRGTSTGSFKSRADLLSQFGTVINLLPPRF
ncbi:MAG TPA: sigma-70 family RNA polymerase sigma factor [Opitutaceae bacterium]|nr:sigma-70 family RNA polymerase sigma factor [Opitutaceae bacterium]